MGMNLRIIINNDPEKVIEFDPGSAIFGMRFYSLCSEFENEVSRLKRRVRAGSQNRREQREKAATKELCRFMRKRIDSLFGPGTSQTAFGNIYSLNSMTSFFNGIAGVMRNHQANQEGG